MNTSATWSAAAARLIGQRRALVPIEPLPESLRPLDEAEGYALQQEVRRQLAADGLGPAVGHKIGCTTAVMQAFLGIPNPCGGNIYAAGVLRGGARVPRSRFVRLGMECEIAVELGRDLGAAQGPYDRERVAAAVRAVMPAIEIVDDRYSDFRAVGVPTLIADDFFHSGCVLGEPVTDWHALDLAALAGATFLDGVEAGRGTGASVMGHPLEALAWLANARARVGLAPLREGEFVLLGSLVETKWLDAGMQTRIEIDRLGTLTLDVDP
jgi:2-oxo-3-hexenedioate decarboxylase/2-keto-4-pentenoate hydratase